MKKNKNGEPRKIRGKADKSGTVTYKGKPVAVTKDGKPTPFWEGGKGYTNSIVKRVPEAQEIEPINPTVYPSININKLINDKTDWLHLDVEGYDHILIKSLKNLPNCIIFEWENLLTEELKDIKNFLTNKGYKLDFENNVSCLALKTN